MASQSYQYGVLTLSAYALHQALLRDPVEVILVGPDGREIERGFAERNADGTVTYKVVAGGTVDHVTVNGVPVPLPGVRALLPDETVTTPRVTILPG